MKGLAIIAAVVLLGIGFVAGIEVETNYCKSYYEGFKR